MYVHGKKVKYVRKTTMKLLNRLFETKYMYHGTIEIGNVTHMYRSNAVM